MFFSVSDLKIGLVWFLCFMAYQLLLSCGGGQYSVFSEFHHFTLDLFLISKEASGTHFCDCGMTSPGIKSPSPGPLANTLNIMPIDRLLNICKMMLSAKQKSVKRFFYLLFNTKWEHFMCNALLNIPLRCAVFYCNMII